MLADAQTAGRGRQGRALGIAAGQPVPLGAAAAARPMRAAWGRLPLAGRPGGGGGARRARRRARAEVAERRLVAGRKVAGILVEAASAGGGLESAVVGVGVNVARVPDGLAAGRARARRVPGRFGAAPATWRRSRPRSWRDCASGIIASLARARGACWPRGARARCPGGAGRSRRGRAAPCCAASRATSTSAARSSSPRRRHRVGRCTPAKCAEVRLTGADSRPDAMSLLLTIDVGNTNTVLGVHEGDDAPGALAPHHAPRADRPTSTASSSAACSPAPASTPPTSAGVALASVVPPLTPGAGRPVARSTSGRTRWWSSPA